MAGLQFKGSTPYCYAYCLSMMLGRDAPSIEVIEFATCSPFGMQIIDGFPYFDPIGWDPLLSLTDALTAMGWTAKENISQTADEAMTHLRAALDHGPVFVGPVDMQFLTYQPGFPGSDHYLIVLEIDQENMVYVHDPAGHPWAVLPIADFLKAWGSRLPYGQPFTMRTAFTRREVVNEETIIRRTLSAARKWLSPTATAQEAIKASKLVENLHPGLKGFLLEFAIRVGARRMADAAVCLAKVGYMEAAAIFERQARIVGGMQYYVRKGNKQVVSKLLKELATTYEPLAEALEEQGTSGKRTHGEADLANGAGNDEK